MDTVSPFVGVKTGNYALEVTSRSGMRYLLHIHELIIFINLCDDEDAFCRELGHRGIAVFPNSQDFIYKHRHEFFDICLNHLRTELSK